GRQEPARPAAGGPEQERWQAVRRRGVGAIVLGALLAALPARAATLLPLVPPPPDLTALIPFAEAPLDKPPIGVVDLALPEGPTDLPSFPPATVVAPWGDKPTAAVAHPGKLACVGAFFGVASMALECGRERYTKAEYEDAAKALEQAVRSGSEKDLVLEARYWLGETYWQLGRVEPADRLFRQVVQTAPKASDFALWATPSGAWASTTAPRRSSSGSSRGAPTRCWTPAGSGSAGGASPRGARSRARTRSARISHRPRPRRRPGPVRSATGPRPGSRSRCSTPTSMRPARPRAASRAGARRCASRSSFASPAPSSSARRARRRRCSSRSCSSRTSRPPCVPGSCF